VQAGYVGIAVTKCKERAVQLVIADCGTPDCGTPDCGTTDCGTPDCGTPDCGTLPKIVMRKYS